MRIRLIVVSMFLMMEEGKQSLMIFVLINFRINWKILFRIIVSRNSLKLLSLVMVLKIIMVSLVVGLFILVCDWLSVFIIILVIILVISLENKGVLEVSVIFRYKGRVMRKIINEVGIFLVQCLVYFVKVFFMVML